MARKMTEWPSKRGPITKIMPSDGCIGDTVPLAVGKWYDFHEFGWYMGNVGVINSQRGGAGLTAQEYVLKKPADGYTVIALTQTHLYTMARGKTKMKIDDIIGIARAMDDPNVIMVSKDSPYKTLSDLVAASKKKKLKWGIGDIGNTEHVGIVRFGKVFGMEFVQVPFGGGSGVLQAVMSGAIDGMAESMSESRAQIDEGN